MEVYSMKLTVLLTLTTVLLASLAAPALAQDEGIAPAEKPEKKEESTVHVLMQTSMGDIALALNNEKAPTTVENFLGYIERGHYDGTIFHRVIPTFMIQGGGFTPDMEQKSTDRPIKNEWKNGLRNERGSIAMARLGGQPDSATAQFFINVENNTFLDEPRDGAGYAVFGKVVSGMDVVDRIRQVPTSTHGATRMADVPVEPVVIRTVRRMTDDEVSELKSGPEER
jgi:peptidyl-prolyl cis-trans isomerase A (cyclophilin A)